MRREGEKGKRAFRTQQYFQLQWVRLLSSKRMWDPTRIVCAAHPHSRKIFSLEQVQRKAMGWSEGQRVSLGQEYVYLSVTEVTAERYLSRFENRW